jgi:hypothetical protein
VQYWAGDLEPAESERVDEHLMGCASCSAEAARVAAVVMALRELVPPVLSRASLRGLQARGLRVREDVFAPGRKAVTFPRDVDLLILRLTGFDLASAVRVRVAVRRESTRELYVEEPNAPFDAQEGVLIACQRHAAEMPPDVLFEVVAIDATGAERTVGYSIPHTFER